MSLSVGWSVFLSLRVFSFESNSTVTGAYFNGNSYLIYIPPPHCNQSIRF